MKKNTAIAVVLGSQKLREGGGPPRNCFITHMLQNKELFPLKQWHLKGSSTDRTMSFIYLKRYVMLP